MFVHHSIMEKDGNGMDSHGIGYGYHLLVFYHILILSDASPLQCWSSACFYSSNVCVLVGTCAFVSKTYMKQKIHTP